MIIDFQGLERRIYDFKGLEHGLSHCSRRGSKEEVPPAHVGPFFRLSATSLSQMPLDSPRGISFLLPRVCSVPSEGIFLRRRELSKQGTCLL